MHCNYELQSTSSTIDNMLSISNAKSFEESQNVSYLRTIIYTIYVRMYTYVYHTYFLE